MINGQKENKDRRNCCYSRKKSSHDEARRINTDSAARVFGPPYALIRNLQALF